MLKQAKRLTALTWEGRKEGRGEKGQRDSQKDGKMEGGSRMKAGNLSGGDPGTLHY